MCIRNASWVSRHPNLLTLRKVRIKELDDSFDYEFQNITNFDDLKLNFFGKTILFTSKP